MRMILLAIFGFASMCSHAYAWGDEGHKIICELAFRLSAPDTRAAIGKLIQSDDEFSTFSDSCIYPDHPRRRAEEHFLNLPRDSKGLVSDECPAASKCVLTAILNDFKVLASKSENSADRLIALKYLGHWVGDIHQPLHVSFADDRGGNTIQVSGECTSNLHATWDSCLVESAVGPDVADAATDLINDINPVMTAKWVASRPRDWANESFAISEDGKTDYCVMHGASCDRPAGSLQVTPDYLSANEPVVREQLQKAGVRLAHLLDEAFGSAGGRGWNPNDPERH